MLMTRTWRWVTDMAYEELVGSISLDADASIGIYTGVPGLPGSAKPNVGKQYCFVKITGEHRVGLATAATDPVVGVLYNKPQMPGQAATVALWGVVNVQCGAAVAAGDYVTADANGKAVKTTTKAEAAGVALGAGGVAGALVPVLLRGNR
jgi:Uncharacterized conserved protein (DUF2190)